MVSEHKVFKISFHQTFKDITDPIVLKYSAITIIIASTVIWAIGHFILEQGISFIFNVLPLEQWLPSFGNYVGILSFILAFFLFSLAMPLLSAVIFPVTAFFQIMFFESFANEFQKKYYNNCSTRRIGTFTNFITFIKWTILKIIFFMVLAPIFHIPAAGSALHLFLITFWITIIYNEIVKRKYCENTNSFSCFKKNIKSLFVVALTGMTLNYFCLWLLMYISMIFPPVRPLLLLILITILISSNYVMAAEFIRASISNESLNNGKIIVLSSNSPLLE